MVFSYSINKDKTLLGNDILGEDVSQVANFYANFKIKPTEIIKALPEKAQIAIRKMCNERDIEGIITILRQYENSQMLMSKCVREFTNAIFKHEQIVKYLVRAC